MKTPAQSTLWLAAALALASCASVSSRPAVSNSSENNGLVYSLPNRMIDLQVEFSDTGEHKITLRGGSYYPDVDEKSRFVARIHKGKIGTIKATLTTSDGLLATADAKYTGQATALAEALGAALGVIGSSGRDVLSADDAAPCKRKLTVTHSLTLSEFRKRRPFNVLGGDALCANVSLGIEPIGQYSRGPPPEAGKRANGLWYRVELPYTVRATLGNSITATTLILLPNESPAYFVEMDAGIFADAENKMAFTNGVLTSYERSNDSEVISLFKLPAGVIAAYAKAVGDVFSNFSTAEKHEVNAEVARINRELLLIKIEACNLAISQDQPVETIKELCNIQPLP